MVLFVTMLVGGVFVGLMFLLVICPETKRAASLFRDRGDRDIGEGYARSLRPLWWLFFVVGVFQFFGIGAIGELAQETGTKFNLAGLCVVSIIATFSATVFYAGVIIGISYYLREFLEYHACEKIVGTVTIVEGVLYGAWKITVVDADKVKHEIIYRRPRSSKMVPCYFGKKVAFYVEPASGEKLVKYAVVDPPSLKREAEEKITHVKRKAGAKEEAMG